MAGDFGHYRSYGRGEWFDNLMVNIHTFHTNASEITTAYMNENKEEEEWPGCSREPKDVRGVLKPTSDLSIYL
jgi:hypothetical protein